METDFALPLRARTHSAFMVLIALVLLVSTCGGCTIFGSRNVWNPPAPYRASLFAGDADPCLAAAEAQYAAGQEAEAACNAVCVDHYFAAATQTWPHHAASVAQEDSRGSQLYRSAVRGMIDSAARLGRYDRSCGIVLASGQVVPVTYNGFLWQPADFCTFLPVGCYASQRVSRQYASGGVGVPYVVLTAQRPRQPFIQPEQPFAATAVVSPAPSLGGSFALAFYDPLRANATDTGLPLARDLTAPIAYSASHETDDWLTDFLRPERYDPLNGLHMREPFQSGKIPVVFVHGLASDPLTWAEMENELRNKPAVYSRYQFWFFRYSTGDPFLSSATRLREDLHRVRRVYDPMRMDPNLSRMVLVGHSMGGLLSKLQVTYSGETLWNSAAMQPIATLRTDPTTRAHLQNAFYFGPSPDVQRVVYIATPHRGSHDATRCVGRISSALVENRPDLVEKHQQLVRDNPCAFRSELQRKVPTSVDLLEPSSCILQATDALPYSSNVALHSVIGDVRWSPLQGRTDGVVAVSSARIGGVQSELFVDANHTEVQRDSRTVEEVACILLRHAGR